jgi:hypothetical protein
MITGIVLFIAVGLLHAVCGAFWASERDKTGWEAWAIVITMFLFWWVFAVRMMWRGYDSYMEEK